MKVILNLIYKLLVAADKIIYKIFKKSFLYYLKDLFEKDLYVTKKILNNDTSFYVPNKVTKWRIETFYEKEPETLEWIDSFNNAKKIIFWDIGANIGLYSIYAALKHKNIEIISNNRKAFHSYTII